MIVVNILLVLNVSAYYCTIAEGVILILAVLGGSLTRDSPLADYLGAGSWARARRGGRAARAARPADRRLPAGAGSLAPAAPPAFLRRHAETLRFALPAYICLVLVVVATQLWLGNARSSTGPTGTRSSCSPRFLAVLALGQGAVILTGGLDLSVPWTIGLSGILLAGIVERLRRGAPLRAARSSSRSRVVIGARRTGSASSGSASRRSS